jgi:hypothetical protein
LGGRGRQDEIIRRAEVGASAQWGLLINIILETVLIFNKQKTMCIIMFITI